jgi:nuclear protein localization family protein 4
MLDDPDEALVDDMAAQLGLRRVGWIFTDLETESPQAGTVKHKRFVTCVL